MTFLLRKISLFTILVTGAITVAHSQTFYSVRGKDILAPNGQPIVLKGTNLGNWLVPEGYMFKFKDINSPRMIDQLIRELVGPSEADAFWKKFLDVYITAEDIRYLKTTGINSIRVPFNYRLFTNEHYMGASDSTRGFLYLDRLISWCKQEELPIILDMHCAPGGQTGDNIDDGYGYPFLFEDEKSQQQCIDIWHRIATRYANEPYVIGYDLLNEPIAHYFDKNYFNPLLEPLYKKITAAIRKADRNHLVFLGGAQWNSNFTPFGPPFDNKLVYSFHKYWTPPTRAVIQDYLDFSNKYNVPLHCGETGENDDAWVQTFRELLDSNRISWHYWPYKKPDNTKGFMNFNLPNGYDSVISYSNQVRKNFEAIRQQRPADRKLIKAALDGFLENSRFKNCYPNKGYIRALGLKD